MSYIMACVKRQDMAEKLEIIDKWGQRVAENGFAQLPNYLLLLNQFLSEEDKLPPVELIVLIQLAGAWWKKDEDPFPSMKTLSIRCGVSERQIARTIKSLEDKGLLERKKKKIRGIISTNSYSLEPLVNVLNSVAEVFETPFKRVLSKDRRMKQRQANKKISLGKSL